jgi:hypothetical protein
MKRIDSRTTPPGARVVLTAMVLGISCATAQPRSQNVLDDAPAWVVRGSWLIHGVSGRAFLGVGQAKGSADVSRRAETEANARISMAALMHAYVAEIVQRYGALTPAPDDVAVDSEAMRSLVTRQVLAAPIQDRWISKDGSTEFAETQFELENFQESLVQLHELSDRMREFIRQQAPPIFDALVRPEKHDSLPH